MPGPPKLPLIFVDDLKKLTGDGTVAGTAIWTPEFDRLRFVCPCGCQHMVDLPLKPTHQNGWNWDGDRQRPSFTPSILNKSCGWHGYLVAGEWVTV